MITTSSNLSILYYHYHIIITIIIVIIIIIIMAIIDIRIIYLLCLWSYVSSLLLSSLSPINASSYKCNKCSHRGNIMMLVILDVRWSENHGIHHHHHNLHYSHLVTRLVIRLSMWVVPKRIWCWWQALTSELIVEDDNKRDRKLDDDDGHDG